MKPLFLDFLFCQSEFTEWVPRAVELVARLHVLSCCEQRLVYYFLGWDQVAVSCCDEESMHLANHSRVCCEGDCFAPACFVAIRPNAGGNNFITFGNEADMHLVDPRDRLCVT